MAVRATKVRNVNIVQVVVLIRYDEMTLEETGESEQRWHKRCIFDPFGLIKTQYKKTIK